MTGRKRGPYAKSAERRESIGAAALEIVLEEGHRQLTHARVAQSTGLSEAAVAYHFPKRDELFLSALDAREQWVFEGIDGPPGELTGDLEPLVELMRDRMSNQYYLRLFAIVAGAASDPEHPAHEWLGEHHRRAREGMAILLRRRKERELAHHDVDPDDFARQMVAVWDGLQIQWLSDPTFDLPKAVEDVFLHLSRADTMKTKRAIESFAADL